MSDNGSSESTRSPVVTASLCFSSIDLDYIYFCELVGVCAVFDYGDMEVTSLKIVPPVVKQGMQ